MSRMKHPKQLIILCALLGMAGSLWADNFSGTTTSSTLSTVSKTNSKTTSKGKAQKKKGNRPYPLKRQSECTVTIPP